MDYKDLPFFVRVASDFWFLLGFFAASTILFHLILVHWKKLSKRAWKKVDYIWLIIAAFALIPSANEARRFLGAIQAEQLKYRIEADYRMARYFIQSGSEWTCREFSKNVASPPDFDRVENEYAVTCAYYKALLADFPKDALVRFEPISLTNAIQRPNVTVEQLRDSFVGVDLEINSYNTDIARYNELTKLLEKSEAEDTLLVLGPLLLALALSLRITKVTGEIRIEGDGGKEKPHMDNSANSTPALVLDGGGPIVH